MVDNNHNNMPQYSSNHPAFQYKRRGFDFILQTLIVLIVVSVILLIFYNWKIGLFLLMINCIYFITIEAISARPDNNPVTFLQWRHRTAKTAANCPILLCIGDSITHGNCSASYTSEIPYQLSLKLGLPIPPDHQTFGEPIYVVNAGQNSITSYTVLKERFLPYVQTIHPDYIMLLIGTNDIQSIYRPNIFGTINAWMNPNIPHSERPSLQNLERNIQQMIQYIINEEMISPHVQFAICTIPPLGENLNSRSNVLVRQANQMIERLVQNSGCARITLIPLYNELEKIIQTEKKVQYSIPYDIWLLMGLIMYPLYHLSYGAISWNILSKLLCNHIVLSDGLHLNEYGRNRLVQLIITDWLYKRI